jgi:hypothetical protein
MKRSGIILFLLFAGVWICYAQISAKAVLSIDLFSDIDMTQKIATVEKGQSVVVIGSAEAHRQDPGYWGFDVQSHQGAVRVSYTTTQGYVDFLKLEAAKSTYTALLHSFSDKILVPVTYCQALAALDSTCIEQTDPFVLKYDQYIKYSFVDDIHQQWQYNYPINRSFANDLFFQFCSSGGRYIFSGFIASVQEHSFSATIEANFDLFRLYDERAAYEVGHTYRFSYILDGDYFSVSDGQKKLFDGVFIDRSTWDAIYYFLYRQQNREKFRESSASDARKRIIWPRHKNGQCDFKKI